ncbi:hypothetical protein COO60DRAFT_1546156 [Scenedesmus sp. NREL 46B-D3]|nr:hypothetical protein COO60DRAFT_1546156 [Scenedesmus sp. NREL 46B-D3]
MCLCLSCVALALLRDLGASPRRSIKYSGNLSCVAAAATGAAKYGRIAASLLLCCCCGGMGPASWGCFMSAAAAEPEFH